jgi:hypothetical protein
MSRQATAVKQATAVWQTTQFLSVLDLSPAELEACLQLAAPGAHTRRRWPAATSRSSSTSRRCARVRPS